MHIGFRASSFPPSNFSSSRFSVCFHALCIKVLLPLTIVATFGFGIAQAQLAASYVPSWVQRTPATSPPARYFATMAYDAATGQMVLFGGGNSVATFGDTWTYDGTTWTQQSPATSPPARNYATMAYDAATGQVVLFGGYDSNYSLLGDTWTYNGTTWTQQSPATAPPARIDATMAYDAATSQVVLFGGDGSSGYLADTWTYNGTTWTQQNPAISPAARYGAMMTYDAATSQVVLFSGDDSNGNPYGDTWTWNGTTWTQQSPATSPAGRVNATMAYDATTGQVVLFSGLALYSFSADTWTYDGTTWTQQSPATSPAARYDATMAYDAATGEILVFSGTDENANKLNDTWAYRHGSLNLGMANVCSVGTPAPCSLSATLTFLFSGTSGTIKAPVVSTQGAAGLDFTDAGSGTCTTNGISHTYAAGDTCTVVVTFTPGAPGLRLGAANLLNSSGTVIASALLSGTGTAPQLLFQPGVASTTYSTSLSSGSGLTVDASGNVYVGNQGSSTVLKYAAGSSTPTTLVTASGNTAGTAVDGSGNVYYSVAKAGSTNIYELVGGSGTAVELATLPNSDKPDSNLSVDAAGNLYVTGQSAGAIYEIAAGSQTATTLVTGVSGQRFIGMAIDGSGNLFAADYSNNILYELQAGTTSLKTLASGTPLSNPDAVAVDAAGNIYVANAGGTSVFRYAASNYGATPATLAASGQYSLAIGATGTLYTVSGSSLLSYTRTGNPPLAFASTAVGTTSTDSPQTVTIENDGNALLTFANPATGGNPSITTGFTIGNGSTCPQLTQSSGAGTLASGASCTDLVSFAPVAIGNDSGSLVTTDNTLNAASSAQAVTLSGTTTIGNKTITFPQPPNQPVGTYYTLTATASNGDPVTYSITSGPATLSGSVITYTAQGTVVIAADSAANANYNAAPTVSDTVTVTYPGTYTAPTTAIGATSATQTAYVTFTTAGTPAVIGVYTQGASGLDYGFVTGGTCSTTTAYTVGQSCSVSYTFTPRAPGQRFGAVELLSSGSGTVLGTSLLTGIGTGAAVVFPGNGSTATPVNAFVSIGGVAVDDAGNIYVTDNVTNTVQETVAVGGNIPANNPTIRTLGSSFNYPGSLAVDGAGNVYVADVRNNAVKEIVAIGGSIPASNPTIRTLGSGFKVPGGVAVDGAGNVYVADTSNSAVKEIVAVGGSIPAGNPTILTLGSGFSRPSGVTVDRAGNVYVADQGNNAVKEIVAVGGSIPASNPTILTLGSGFSGPVAVTVDAVGNVYVADQSNNAVKEIVAVGGSVPASNPTILTLGSGFHLPVTVAVDGAGNVYEADYRSDAVTEIPLTTPPSLTLASTPAGTTSSDSPQALELQNIGNSSLTFGSTTVSTNFGVGTAATSPCRTTLASGTFCNVGVNFTPTAAGSLTGTLTLSDDSLTATSASQTALLSGTATTGTKTITFPQPATPMQVNTFTTLTAYASGGDPVTYSVNGVGSASAIVSGSTITYLTPGLFTITANSATTSSYFAATPVAVSVYVLPSASYISWQPSTLSIYTGTALGTGVLDATDSVSASITYTTALQPSGSPVTATASTVLSQGKYILSANFAPTDPDYPTVSDSLLFDVQNMNVFVANGNSVSSFFNNGTAQSAATGGGISAAVDSTGYVWSINSDGAGLTKFTDAGAASASYTGVGLSGATALAIDGSGQILVANANHTLSVLSNAGAVVSTVSDPSLSGVTGVAVDSSGSVWLSNGTTNTVSEVLGGAVPAAPLANAVSNSSTGVKP